MIEYLGTEQMLRKTDGSDQATMAAGRIVAFDRARTFITLLVVIHHSVVNFTYFGNGDRIRWLSFARAVLFNATLFIAFVVRCSVVCLLRALVLFFSLFGGALSAGAAGGGRGRRVRGGPLSVSFPTQPHLAVPRLFLYRRRYRRRQREGGHPRGERRDREA